MKHFSRFCLLVGFWTFVSCTSDSDILPNFKDFSGDWNSSLSEIVDDNSNSFSNKGLALTDIKLLDADAIDNSLFFNEEYGYFPVYSKKDTTFNVVSYDKYNSTSEENSIKMKKVFDVVKEKIAHKDDYNFVQLTWKHGKDTFKTIALFDKKTGELEYDNMLFNMQTISKYDSRSFASLISMAEFSECVETKSEHVDFYEGLDCVARASVTWNVYGRWIFRDYDLDEYSFVRYYDYSHDHVDYSNTSWAQEDYETYVAFAELGAMFISSYDVKYALWAGPEGCFNGTDFVIYLEDYYSFSDRYSFGVGNIEEYVSYPSRPSELLPKYQ